RARRRSQRPGAYSNRDQTAAVLFNGASAPSSPTSIGKVPRSRFIPEGALSKHLDKPSPQVPVATTRDPASWYVPPEFRLTPAASGWGRGESGVGGDVVGGY